MKRSAVILSVVLGHLVFGCECKVPIPKGADPNIAYDSNGTDVDGVYYGLRCVSLDDGFVVDEGQSVALTVLCRNEGRATVYITGVYTSCGCMIAKEPERSQLYPGETEELVIEFDSTGKAQEIDNSVTIVTRDSSHNVHTENLVIHGRIRNRLVANPGKITFQDVLADAVYMETVHVYSDLSPQFDIVSFDSPHEGIEAFWTPFNGKSYHGGYEISIYLKPGLNFLANASTGRFILSGHSDSQFVLPISWTYFRAIDVVPASIVLFGSEKVEREIVLRGSQLGFIPSNQVRMEIGGGSLTEGAPSDSNEVRLLLQVIRLERSAELSLGKIEILFDDPLQYPTIYVPIVVTWN